MWTLWSPPTSLYFSPVPTATFRFVPLLLYLRLASLYSYTYLKTQTLITSSWEARSVLPRLRGVSLLQIGEIFLSVDYSAPLLLLKLHGALSDWARWVCWTFKSWNTVFYTNVNPGYRMAKNLRTKLPEGDTLMVQDVNTAATKQFVEELSGYDVIVAENPRQVALTSVSFHLCSQCRF